MCKVLDFIAIQKMWPALDLGYVLAREGSEGQLSDDQGTEKRADVLAEGAQRTGRTQPMPASTQES